MITVKFKEKSIKLEFEEKNGKEWKAGHLDNILKDVAEEFGGVKSGSSELYNIHQDNVYPLLKDILSGIRTQDNIRLVISEEGYKPAFFIGKNNETEKRRIARYSMEDMEVMAKRLQENIERTTEIVNQFLDKTERENNIRFTRGMRREIVQHYVSKISYDDMCEKENFPECIENMLMEDEEWLVKEKGSRE